MQQLSAHCTHLRGAPASGPRPVTTLKTPGGKPTSFVIAAISKQVRLASSEGFSTTVLPAASAGAVFHVLMSRGLHAHSHANVPFTSYKTGVFLSSASPQTSR